MSQKCGYLLDSHVTVCIPCCADQEAFDGVKPLHGFHHNLNFLAMKTIKKTPQKVAYLSRILVVSEAQLAEFMFQNVAYRATV